MPHSREGTGDPAGIKRRADHMLHLRRAIVKGIWGRIFGLTETGYMDSATCSEAATKTVHTLGVEGQSWTT